MAQDGGSMAFVVGGGNKMYSLAGYPGIRDTCLPRRNQMWGSSIQCPSRRNSAQTVWFRWLIGNGIPLELQRLLLTHDYSTYSTSYPTLGKRYLLSWFQRVLLLRTRYLRDGQYHIGLESAVELTFSHKLDDIFRLCRTIASDAL